MGVPGVAAYVIVATVSTPILIQLGVTPIAAHMFVLIYACLSNITPPVALSSYVAAGIANANQTQVSFTAVKLGLIGFIMPFFFIFDPILLFNGEFSVDFVIAALSAIVGGIALAIGLQGWLFNKIHMVTRIILFIVSFLMIDPGKQSDAMGAIIFIIVLAWQFFIFNKKKTRLERADQQTM